ncbi:MAG: hypothetical protein JWQ75_1678 [Pseudarthrobacter sp.]|nr:hypothetical protein [Pseudarthrobacter sp.]
MDIRKFAGTAPDTARVDTGAKPAPGGFRIRYGRAAIALAAVIALLTALVAGILLPFGLGTPLLPVGAFLLSVGALALLRWLAVRDRKNKVNAAFRAAMSAPARRDGTQAPGRAPSRPDQASPQPEIPLFDAEANQPKPQPLTAVELREAALAVAVAAGDTSAASTAVVPSGATWEPVDVPKPVYVDAAKAERPDPEPLDLPEAPKAVGKPSLKQGSSATPAAPPVPAATKPLTKAQSALSNLDDVLQRRRA